jgi:alpha-acetolactate decarboxylase
MMNLRRALAALACCVSLVVVDRVVAQDAKRTEPTSEAAVVAPQLVQIGEMHEVIGKQQHQGRVNLAELIAKPHFYGVGALAGLRGEISILDSRVTATEVDVQRQPVSLGDAAVDQQATLVIGAYVDAWTEIPINKSLDDGELDAFIDAQLSEHGFDPARPCIFMVRGQFARADLHVINGACPMHARIRQLEIPTATKPYKVTLENVSGRVVGIFAKDAVGKITHPATRTHKHLVYQTGASPSLLTGHAEMLWVKAGSTLLLPQRGGLAAPGN